MKTPTPAELERLWDRCQFFVQAHELRTVDDVYEHPTAREGSLEFIETVLSIVGPADVTP